MESRMMLKIIQKSDLFFLSVGNECSSSLPQWRKKHVVASLLQASEAITALIKSPLQAGAVIVAVMKRVLEKQVFMPDRTKKQLQKLTVPFFRLRAVSVRVIAPAAFWSRTLSRNLWAFSTSVDRLATVCSSVPSASFLKDEIISIVS